MVIVVFIACDLIVHSSNKRGEDHWRWFRDKISDFRDSNSSACHQDSLPIFVENTRGMPHSEIHTPRKSMEYFNHWNTRNIPLPPIYHRDWFYYHNSDRNCNIENVSTTVEVSNNSSAYLFIEIIKTDLNGTWIVGRDSILLYFSCVYAYVYVCVLQKS